MKLDVIEAKPAWYAGGLQFTCTQCGNCCTGAPGFVWISETEIARLAEYLELSEQETVRRYCREVGGKFSLRERISEKGEYDCIFLGRQPDGTRTCGVYPARPLQCRTWPFWHGNLASREAWDTAAKRCHGMNSGKHFSEAEIAAMRDAD
jgi:uncharacterized protein